MRKDLPAKWMAWTPITTNKITVTIFLSIFIYIVFYNHQQINRGDFISFIFSGTTVQLCFEALIRITFIGDGPRRPWKVMRILLGT
jgi:ABC-type Fe3+-siderophore transport system permease subunit